MLENRQLCYIKSFRYIHDLSGERKNLTLVGFNYNIGNFHNFWKYWLGFGSTSHRDVESVNIWKSFYMKGIGISRNCLLTLFLQNEISLPKMLIKYDSKYEGGVRSFQSEIYKHSSYYILLACILNFRLEALFA